jgi:hypothetical protein
MTDASALAPLVMGIGLAVLTTSHTPGSPGDSDRQRAAALFTMTVQLIGFVLVAFALFVVGWYVENGHRVARGDLRVENWLIGALAFLMVVMVIRNAWIGFAGASSASPWDRGMLDRANTLVMFLLALFLVLIFGLTLDLVLIKVGVSTIRFSDAALLVAGVVLVVLCASALMVRYLLGEDASPRILAMSRSRQRRLLHKLGDASGSWLSISVKAAAELEPDLAMSVTVWSTERGLYWRVDDACALARYHAWAGNHATIPVAALHSQRVSVPARFRDFPRVMRITRTTRRLWLLDAWRARRCEPPLARDADSPERRAGLVHIAYAQLQAAGLVVTVRRAPPVARAVAPAAKRPDPAAPVYVNGTRETTSPGRAAP